MRDLGYTRNGGPDEGYTSLPRFVSKMVKPSAEFVTVNAGLNASSWHYVTGAGATTSAITQGVGKLISKQLLQLTWWLVPRDAVGIRGLNPSLAADGYIDTLVGKVNAETFLGYGVGTLLMLPPDVRPRRSPVSARLVDVVFNLSYNPNTHTKIFNAQTGTWVEIRTGSGATNLVTQTAGVSVYDYGKLANVFRTPGAGA
jgi:hypothetical protein